jgi:hypothetical protein
MVNALELNFSRVLSSRLTPRENRENKTLAKISRFTVFSSNKWSDGLDYGKQNSSIALFFIHPVSMPW